MHNVVNVLLCQVVSTRNIFVKFLEALLFNLALLYCLPLGPVGFGLT